MKRKPSIRIISGINKGYKINFEYSDSLRPTSDRLKKILFDWLQFKINNSCCLDLFAGTGSLGLECLSLGASHLISIEKIRQRVKFIENNIYQLEAQEISQVLCKDAIEWLKNNTITFDLIFLDPPFEYKQLPKILDLIISKELLNKNGLIYLEQPKRNHIMIPERMSLHKEKIIGEVRGSLLSWK